MSYDYFPPGAVDLEWRAANLAVRLSDGLRPLARVAYNYRWSWDPDGAAVFLQSALRTFRSEFAAHPAHWRAQPVPVAVRTA